MSVYGAIVSIPRAGEDPINFIMPIIDEEFSTVRRIRGLGELLAFLEQANAQEPAQEILHTVRSLTEGLSNRHPVMVTLEKPQD